MYVSSVSEICCGCFEWMLQVNQDICIYCKCFRGMLQVFQRHVASVSEACCKRMFKIFHLFQIYVASVCSKCFICFRHMLRAFLSGHCICFTPMLQEFVRNVSYISVLCCNLQVFYLDVAYVSHTYCNCMLQMFYLL
jgi:hypothetical protein